MTQAGLQLRVATGADATHLAALGVETFTDTFGHQYPPADLHAYLQHAHSVEAWQQLLANSLHRTWLAESDAGPLGYVVAGPCSLPHPDVTPTAGELKRLYVSRAHHGAGLGRLLFDTAIDWLQQQQRQPIWLGVYSENHRALAMYLRRGFVQVGEYEFVVGTCRDRELILRRA